MTMYVHMSQILCCPLAHIPDLCLIHRLLQGRLSTTASILEFRCFGFIFHDKGHGPQKSACGPLGLSMDLRLGTSGLHDVSGT